MKIRSVVSHTFQTKHKEMYNGARHGEQWVDIHLNARQAAHENSEQAFALWRSVFVLYITQALQGRIGHTNETEENSRARLCAKLKSHHFRTHMHTHTLTLFETLSK